MTLTEPLDLPLPDDDARSGAADRLATLDLPGAGFGALGAALDWAAGVQGRADPAPFASVRVVVVAGDHAGGIAAGHAETETTRRASAELAGTGPLARLAARLGASLEVVDACLSGPPLAPDVTTRIRDGARPIEEADACTEDDAMAGLTLGRKLADSLADSGVDLLLLASVGAGAEVAAAAGAAHLTRLEAPALLARVATPDGTVDDTAWMRRCATVRDALTRVRYRPRDTHTVLSSLGGPDLAVATGLLLGAAARRTPVLLDGPVGLTAALLARDLATQVTHWCLAPDTSRHPTAETLAKRIDLDPFLDLRLDLGEGAAALTALGPLQAALDLAHSTGASPAGPTRNAAGGGAAGSGTDASGAAASGAAASEAEPDAGS